SRANNPTLWTGGPARFRKSSARPRRRNSGRLVTDRYSPQTLRLGKRALSTTATLQPAWASSSAAVAPPGPPPRIIASKSPAIACIGALREALRDKTVAEQADCLLLQPPVSLSWPQRRKLPATESGAHAVHRIVARHTIAAEQPKRPAGGQPRRASPRLARQKTIRSFGGQLHQAGQCRIRKMVQKQVRGDQIDSPAGRSAQPVEHVQFHRLRLPGERFEPTTRLRADDPLSIHEFDFHIAPLPREPTRHAQHQSSGPSAQIHQPAPG